MTELFAPATCAATGKARFRTRKYARRFLKQLSGKSRHCCRAYRCEHCGGFHLTKMDRPLYVTMQRVAEARAKNAAAAS